MTKDIFFTDYQYNYGRIALLLFLMLAVSFGLVALILMFTHQDVGVWVELVAAGLSLIGVGYYADQYTVVTDSSKAIEVFSEKECYTELKEVVSGMKRPLTYEEIRRISHLI